MCILITYQQDSYFTEWTSIDNSSTDGEGDVKKISPRLLDKIEWQYVGI